MRFDGWEWLGVPTPSAEVLDSNLFDWELKPFRITIIVSTLFRPWVFLYSLHLYLGFPYELCYVHLDWELWLFSKVGSFWENTGSYNNLIITTWEWRSPSILSLYQCKSPIGSMYGIFPYIYQKLKPNVGKYIKYTSPMDPSWVRKGPLNFSQVIFRTSFA